MEQIAKLIESISSLLWPIMAIVVICLFRPAVGAIVESAKSRKFSLKFGGQELTMEEANEQQRVLISDLQAQIVELRKKVEGVAVSQEVLPKAESTLQAQLSNTILWVDDNPKNNSYFVEQLSNVGISVDLALSTSEGIAKFGRGIYRCVISDMGRTEDGHYDPDVGLDLLQLVRQKDPNVPFVIFCSGRGVQEFGEKAKSLGVTGITSSPTDLFGILKLDQAKPRRRG
jgi:CheY-like chemotaxis protein